MDTVTLFLSGDVMTGRGIDQVLPHPSDPALYEPYVTSAMGYVELAEKAHGQIAHPVAFPYVWGEALEELRSRAPDLRIVNLETSVTTHDRPEPKGINYRMHPDNVPVLTAAGIDCCTLANNHVRDWGIPGLEETLATLRAAGIAVAGAGMNDEEAARPAVLRDGRGRRILVFALGAPSSGVPADWAAAEDRPGVRVLYPSSPPMPPAPSPRPSRPIAPPAMWWSSRFTGAATGATRSRATIGDSLAR